MLILQMEKPALRKGLALSHSVEVGVRPGAILALDIAKAQANLTPSLCAGTALLVG